MWIAKITSRRQLGLLIITFFSLAALGCIDLSAVVEPPLEIRSRPAEHDEVLPAGSPIELSFDRSMDAISVHEVFRIRESGSEVAGVLNAQNSDSRSYVFEPAQAWEPRRRYELVLSGYLSDAEGGTHRVDHRRAFSFGGSAAGPLRLLESYPVAGQGVPPEAEVQLRFSEAVDTAAFERAMSLSPAVVTTSTWSPDLTKVVVRPEQPLERTTVYTLRIADSLQSVDGRSLAEPLELAFVVGDDAEMPLVQELYLAVDAPLLGYPVLSSSLDDMRYGDVIAVRWNVAMEASPTEAATRIEPRVSLEFLWPEPDLMLIRPRTRLEPASEYRLRLSGSVRSAAGLQAAAAYEHAFFTASDTQAVTEWSNSYGAVLNQDELLPGLVLQHEVLDHHDELSLSLLFAAAFRDEAEREHLLSSVRFVSLLPSSAPPPVLFSAHWSDDQSLSLGYRNLGAGTIDAPYRYLWSLPKGWGGSRYATEELRVVLELYR